MRVGDLATVREGPLGTEAFCRGCGKWKLRCEGLDSGFHTNGWTVDGRRQWATRCKCCRNRWQRAYRRGEVGGSRIPAEPYRGWLLAYREAAHLGTNQALADALGVERRRNVSAILNREYERVAIDVVDRAVMNATLVVYVPSLGRTVATLDDLYPLE
jgi:hypothetical protein